MQTVMSYTGSNTRTYTFINTSEYIGDLGVVVVDIKEDELSSDGDVRGWHNFILDKMNVGELVESADFSGAYVMRIA